MSSTTVHSSDREHDNDVVNMNDNEATSAEHKGASTDPRSDERQMLESKLRRSALTALVQDFAPIWFTWCMNTGIISLLTHQLPYQFRGLAQISTIFYILDLLLFVLFMLIFITRFIWFRGKAYRELVSSQPDLLLSACLPISWLTLTSLTPMIDSNAYWGGRPFGLLGYTMWWFGAVWSLLTLFWVFTTLIRRHESSDRRIPMMIIIPAVSISTVAVTGGVVCMQGVGITSTLAVPVVIVSFMMVGGGVLFGFMLSTYLFHQLLAMGWPEPGQRASVFIFIGPMGQSAAALIVLGEGITEKKWFMDYAKGTFLTGAAAEVVSGSCVVLALLLVGLGFIWTLLSIYGMLECAAQKKLSWSMGWNSIIFPTGTLVTATIELAIVMDSSAWRVVSATMLVCLVLVYVVNAVFTLKAIVQGKLLIVRDDPRIKKQLEEEYKEK